jgi:hypothetical protein
MNLVVRHVDPDYHASGRPEYKVLDLDAIGADDKPNCIGFIFCPEANGVGSRRLHRFVPDHDYPDLWSDELQAVVNLLEELDEQHIGYQRPKALTIPQPEAARQNSRPFFPAWLHGPVAERVGFITGGVLVALLLVWGAVYVTVHITPLLPR